MAIGIALVLIFVLYLIDKHNRWRQAFKLTVGLVVLGIVVVGGFFGWQKYQAYRQEKQEQAEAAVQEARILTCVSRLKQIPVPKDAAGADVPGDIQRACDANPDATTYLYVSTSQPLPLASQWQPVPPKRKSKFTIESQPLSQPNCQVVACSDWAVVTGEGKYGSAIEGRNCFDTWPHNVTCETIAVLKRGDRVQILSDKLRSPVGRDIYEVKFQQWTGWTEASTLSPEKGEEK